MKTIIEKVYSPILDKDIKKDINNSTIWNKAYKMEEMTVEELKKYPKFYCYHIKFKGLTPIQVTKIAK